MTFNEWWKESLDKGAVSSDEEEIAKYAFEAGQKAEVHTDNSKVIAELEKENESLENVKNIYIGDLLKAKKIIKDYMIVVIGDHTECCGVPEENRSINVLELNEQAEQFLKEIKESD